MPHARRKSASTRARERRLGQWTARKTAPRLYARVRMGAAGTPVKDGRSPLRRAAEGDGPKEHEARRVMMRRTRAGVKALREIRKWQKETKKHAVG